MEANQNLTVEKRRPDSLRPSLGLGGEGSDYSKNQKERETKRVRPCPYMHVILRSIDWREAAKEYASDHHCGVYPDGGGYLDLERSNVGQGHAPAIIDDAHHRIYLCFVNVHS